MAGNNAYEKTAAVGNGDLPDSGGWYEIVSGRCEPQAWPTLLNDSAYSSPTRAQFTTFHHAATYSAR